MAILKLTGENFEQEVMKSEQPVLIDFWATWCGPCQMIAPVVDKIAEEMKSVKICKVNIDEQPELAQQFRVMSIPTLVVVKDGKVVNNSIGFQQKADIVAMLNV